MTAFRRWIPFAALVAVVAALAAVEVLPRWAGLTNEVALPPLDLLADVRVLTARADSPVFFVLGLLASIGVRSVVLAALLGWSRERLRFALSFYGAATVPALVAASLDFAGRAVLYAYITWAGVAIAVITFALLAPAAWAGPTRLRSAIGIGMREGQRIGVLLLYGGLLGLLITALPREGGWTIAAIPVSAVLTVLAANRLATKPRHVGVGGVAAPACAAILLVAVLVVAVIAGDDDEKPVPVDRDGTLVLMAGVDTEMGFGAMFRLEPSLLGYSCSQTVYFSFRGEGDGAPQGEAHCPIRSGANYTKVDTTRSLVDLEATFLDQIADLPRPIVVVAHEQAAWIAWGALSRDGANGVTDLAMLAPFDTTLVRYPREGHDGPGVVGGAETRLVAAIGEWVDFSEYDPERPLPRDLQGTPGGAQRVFARPLPKGIGTVAVLSRWDAPLQPDGGPSGVRTSCPGWANHNALPTSVDAMRDIDTFLDGRDVDDCSMLRDELGKLLDAIGTPPPG